MRPDIDVALSNIDAMVERVATSNPAGSDINVVAYAIHNLIGCIRDLERDSP